MVIGSKPRRQPSRKTRIAAAPAPANATRLRWPSSMAGKNSVQRSEEHTSELQSLMRISYAVFCLKKKKKIIHKHQAKRHNKIHNSNNDDRSKTRIQDNH